jgi:hypothetical protein
VQAQHADEKIQRQELYLLGLDRVQMELEETMSSVDHQGRLAELKQKQAALLRHRDEEELKLQSLIDNNQRQIARETATRYVDTRTPEEKLAAREYAKKYGAAAGEAAVMGVGAAVPQHVQREAETISKRMEPVNKSRAMFQRYLELAERAKRYGAGVDWNIAQTGPVRAVAKAQTVLGLDAEGTRIINDLAQAENDLLLHGQSAIKGIPSDKDIEILRKAIVGTGSLREKIGAAKRALTTMGNDEKVIKAGASPAAQQWYEKRFRQLGGDEALPPAPQIEEL